MEQDSSLLIDIVVALAIALAGGWIATRIGLSSIVGYIAAGVVISPFTPGFVGDIDRLRLIAEIGVVLIMFGIGLHFSVRDLMATGPRVVAAAVLQVAGVMALGVALGMVAGWGRDQALFAGAAIAISSSTVIVKVLQDSGAIDSRYGRLAITWSIVEDLCAVVLVAVLIALNDDSDIAASIGLASVKAVAFVAGVLLLGLVVLPFVLARVGELASREFFALGVAAMALGTALASDHVGMSFAFGAFLAGMIISEANLTERVLPDLIPARDVFGALFFVSIGMLIDPDVLFDNVGILMGLLAVIIVGKAILTYGLGRLAGFSLGVALPLAALIAQAGEFSFVLVDVGLDEEVVESEVFSIVVAATALSMAATPAFTILASRAMRAFWPAHVDDIAPSGVAERA